MTFAILRKTLVLKGMRALILTPLIRGRGKSPETDKGQLLQPEAGALFFGFENRFMQWNTRYFVRTKEPAMKVTARVRLCRARKLAAQRRRNEDVFRFLLDKIYRDQNLKATDWLAVDDFFASTGVDAVALGHLKTIESSRAIIGAQSFELIRPKYLLEAL